MRIGQSNAGTLGIGGRIFLSLVFGVFALVGGSLFVVMARSAWRTFQTHTWTPTPCTIEGSEFSPESGGGWQLRYRYFFAGAEYRSTVVSENSASRDASEDLRLSQKFVSGQSATCYVDPAQPADAVFVRRSLWSALGVAFPLVFVAIGVGGLIFAWRPPFASRAVEPVAASSLTQRALTKPQRGLIFAAGFFGLFFVIGSVATWAFAVRPLYRVISARSWMAVPCTIVSSRVIEHDSDDGYTYSVGLVYRYDFGGRTYTADRYKFSTGSSSGRKGKQAIVAQFPPGRDATCYVNPADPTEAVIERGYTGEMWFGLIPLVFVLVGGGGIYGVLKYRRGLDQPAGIRRDPHRSMHDASGTTGAVPIAAGIAGPVVLENRRSRMGKFVGLLLFAVVWNGIVSVVFFTTRGDAGLFVTVFMIPFFGIGLLVLGMSGHAGLAILNPRPRLTLSTGALPPGGRLDLQWEMIGSTRRLQRFKILLEGREEATYRRGTDTHTDKSVFATVTLADVRDPGGFATGTAKALVPLGAMHSFAAKNNQIVWRLRVKGEIARWPDIDDEFPFTVLAGKPDATS